MGAGGPDLIGSAQAALATEQGPGLVAGATVARRAVGLAVLEVGQDLGSERLAREVGVEAVLWVEEHGPADAEAPQRVLGDLVVGEAPLERALACLEGFAHAVPRLLSLREGLGDELGPPPVRCAGAPSHAASVHVEVAPPGLARRVPK